VRWLLFSFTDVPFWALVIQLLHGPSYASFIVASVSYIAERTPQGLNTTAMAIFNTVTFGLGSMAGSLLGGYLLDQVGMASLFRVFSLIAITSLFFFLAGQRSDTKLAAYR
jgi:predicted MFS family arabinose efflux permease